MRRRQPRPLPTIWLMTDERMGDALWPALARLPRGAGVVFRHRRTDAQARAAMLARVRRIARARRLTLLIAGAGRVEERHGRGGVSASAHDLREAFAAIRLGARLLFVSPVHATRSHPDARVLGRVRLGLLVRPIARRFAGVTIIALGGMDARRFRALRPLAVQGWAGIDAWIRI